MAPPSRPPPAAGPVHRRVPPGDNRERLVCDDCGFVLYENPKVVVGTVSSFEGGVLLVRRAIEPRRGLWTLPAGFLERHESGEDGALRETHEEAGVHVELEGLLAVYSVVRVSQIQLFYRARMHGPALAPGPESLEARLWPWEEIPWHDLAFPTVEWALRHWRESLSEDPPRTRTNPPGELGDLPSYVERQAARQRLLTDR